MMKTQPIIKHFLKAGQFPGIHYRPDGGENEGAGEQPAGGQTPAEAEPKADISQAALQKLIDEKFDAGYKKAAAEYKAKLEAAEKKKPAEKPNEKPNDSFSKEDVQKILADKENEYLTDKAQLTERLNGFLSMQKTSAIVNAAAKAKARDPQMVAKLVADNIQMDESGKMVIVGPDGRGRIDSKGNDLTVDAFIDEYLNANSFLKLGANTNGSGSSTQNGSQQAVTVDRSNPKAALAAAFKNGGLPRK